MSSKYNLLASVVLLLSIAAMSSATNITWDNQAGDGNWNTGLNWSTDAIPGTASTQYARIAMATGPVFNGETANVYRVYLEGANGTLTMNSGTLNTVSHIYAGVIFTDTATINMSGGAINIGGTFYISRDGNSVATSVADVNLSGGTITCAVLTMGSAGGTGGRINLTSTGTLIINGDANATITPWITSGWIKAYNGLGVVMVDVNNVNPGKTTVWGTFATKAEHPSPANGATDASTWADLSWTGMFEATSHDVYLGTDVNDVNSATDPNVLPGRGNQTALTFDPGQLDQSKTYYWRIDEVTGSGTVTGDVWSFKTAKTKAALLSNQFCPKHGDSNMPIGGIILNWTAGAYAVSHDVYFGTASSGGTSQGNQTDTSFAIPTILTPNTTYYWRIDEKDGSGNTTTGDVNNFTTGDPVGIYPYLTWRSDPTNSMMVNWWNPAATGDSSVDYGLTDGYGSTVNVPALVNYHHVELTGLGTGTTYHYRIRSSDGTTGSDNTFTTAPDPNTTTSFRFAMYGDPRGTQAEDEPFYTRQGVLCDWILAQDFAFALEGGDIVWEGASLKAKGKWWPDWFRIEGNLTKSKVVMHTLGNHEVQGGGTYLYWNDFYTAAFPDTNSIIPGNAGRMYSFDYANAHFVNLAAYQVNLAAQATWLEADLIAAKARPNIKWIFVNFHAPMFTNSGHSNRTDCIQTWGPLFDKYGVNIVFQSHNHVYERSYPLTVYYDTSNPSSPVWTGKPMPDGEGTVYITNGMGGAEFNNSYTSSLITAWFGASNLNVTVVTSITIDGDKRIIVEAIRNDTGEVIDTYEVPPMRLHYDFNKDDIVDVNDLNTLVGSWLNTGIWP